MYGFNEVDVGTLKQWLENNESIKLVDVRTPAELARGVIAGAHLIPLHLLPVRVDDLMEDGVDRLVFYCQSGARSAQACAFIAQQHEAEIYNLRSGVAGWVSAGHSLAPPETMPG